MLACGITCSEAGKEGCSCDVERRDGRGDVTTAGVEDAILEGAQLDVEHARSLHTQSSKF